jgi:hypothetical protein
MKSALNARIGDRESGPRAAAEVRRTTDVPRAQIWSTRPRREAFLLRSGDDGAVAHARGASLARRAAHHDRNDRAIPFR